MTILAIEEHIDIQIYCLISELESKIKKNRNSEWEAIQNIKLREVNTNTIKWTTTRLTRKNQVMLTRLRIGHTKVTDLHQLKKKKKQNKRHVQDIMYYKRLNVF